MPMSKTHLIFQREASQQHNFMDILDSKLITFDHLLPSQKGTGQYPVLLKPSRLLPCYSSILPFCHYSLKRLLAVQTSSCVGS